MPETTARTILPGSLRKAVPNARLVGKSDPKKEINVSVYVRKNPNPPAEAVLKAEKIAKQLPGQRDQLTNDEFNSIYGADQADLETVADWAKANSLQVLNQSVPKRRLLLHGTIDAIQKAFGVQLNHTEDPPRTLSIHGSPASVVAQ